MYITTTEVMENLKEKYQCPREYLMHERSFGTFREMKSAIIKGDEDLYTELEEEFFDGYKDYCDIAGLDPNEDNRKKSTHVYLQGKKSNNVKHG